MTDKKHQLLYEIKQTNQTLSLNYLTYLSTPELQRICISERQRVRALNERGKERKGGKKK